MIARRTTLRTMDSTDLQEVIDLCDVALAVLRQADEKVEQTPPYPSTAMNNIAQALLDRGSLTPAVRGVISLKDQGPLTTAAVSLCIDTWQNGHAFAQYSGRIVAVRRIIQDNIDRLNAKKSAIPHMVFYSWQSDRTSKFNRNFIEEAIEKAIKNVASDGTIEPRLEQGPQGEPGSKSLHRAILDKIDRCGLFVADVTLISDGGKGQCNSNVMYELGYATHCLGEDRVLLICNTKHGRIEDLPFDIKHKIVLGYALGEGDDKAPVRNSLSARIEEKLRLIFSS